MKPGVFLNDGNRPVDFVLVYEVSTPGSAAAGNNGAGNGSAQGGGRAAAPPPLPQPGDESAQQRRYFEKNLCREGLVLEVDPFETDSASHQASGGGSSSRCGSVFV